jgi:hypothetical protein
MSWFANHGADAEYRWAEGSYDRLPGMVADLVGRKAPVELCRHA